MICMFRVCHSGSGSRYVFLDSTGVKKGPDPTCALGVMLVLTADGPSAGRGVGLGGKAPASAPGGAAASARVKELEAQVAELSKALRAKWVTTHAPCRPCMRASAQSVQRVSWQRGSHAALR